MCHRFEVIAKRRNPPFIIREFDKKCNIFLRFMIIFPKLIGEIVLFIKIFIVFIYFYDNYKNPHKWSMNGCIKPPLLS